MGTDMMEKPCIINNTNNMKPLFPLAMTALGALSLLTGAAGSNPSVSRPVLWENFEDPSGRFFSGKLDHEKHLELAEGEGVGGSTALKATYVGYPRGSERIVEPIPLGTSGTEFTLTYDVRFTEAFQFVISGKLHGLGPKKRVTGGNDMNPEGWSARVVWKKEGAPATYLYVQDKESPWGVGDTAETFRFIKGRYHAVSLHVRLNDPASASNGSASIYVDGRKVVESTGQRFRASDTPDSLIQQFLFSTFHGGNKPKHAPRDEDGNYTEVVAYFDNIAVREGHYIKPQPGQDVH
jgi:hypothetical protein